MRVGRALLALLRARERREGVCFAEEPSRPESCRSRGAVVSHAVVARFVGARETRRCQTDGTRTAAASTTQRGRRVTTQRRGAAAQRTVAAGLTYRLRAADEESEPGSDGARAIARHRAGPGISAALHGPAALYMGAVIGCVTGPCARPDPPSRAPAAGNCIGGARRCGVDDVCGGGETRSHRCDALSVCPRGRRDERRRSRACVAAATGNSSASAVVSCGSDGRGGHRRALCRGV